MDSSSGYVSSAFDDYTELPDTATDIASYAAESINNPSILPESTFDRKVASASEKVIEKAKSIQNKTSHKKSVHGSSHKDEQIYSDGQGGYYQIDKATGAEIPYIDDNYGLNDLTALQLQERLGNAIGQHGLLKDEQGNWYKQSWDGQGNEVRTPYNGRTRDLYIDDTVDGNMKLGLARTDQGGFTGRYDPEQHPTWKRADNGKLAGSLGVTPDDGALMNVTLPANIATEIEYTTHMNRGQIRNRVAGEGPINADLANALGSGKSEYTTQDAPVWSGKDTENDKPLEKGTPLPKRIYQMKRTPSVDAIDRVVSGVKSIGSMFGSGVASAADLVTDSVGHIAQLAGVAADVGAMSRDQKGFDDLPKATLDKLGMERGPDGVINTKWFEKYDKQFFDKKLGIGSKRVEKERKLAGKEAMAIYEKSKDQSVTETTKDIMGLMKKHGKLVPEAVGDSLGFLALLYFGGGSKLVPGTIAEGGVVAKGLGALGQTAKAEGGRVAVTAKNVPGVLSIYNDNLSEYKKNNNGKMPESFQGHVNMLGSAALEGKLDYLVDSSVLKGTGLVDSFAKQVAKGLSAETATGAKKALMTTLGTLTKVGGKFTEAMLKEAPTEGLQSLMSAVSQQYGTELYKDKTFTDLIKSDKNIEAMWEGAVVGAAGGGGMSLAGSAKDILVPNIGTAIENINTYSKKKIVDPVKAVEKDKAKLSEGENKDLKKLTKDLTRVDKLDGKQVKVLLQGVDKIESETPDNKYVQEQVKKVKEMISERMSTDDTLGSSMEFTTKEEAESYIEETLAYAKDIDNVTLNANIDEVAKKNNISTEEVRIIKDRATVEAEASTGARGYKTYERRLKRLNADPINNKKTIKRTEEALQNFELTQQDRLGQMKAAINELKSDYSSGKKNKQDVKYSQYFDYTHDVGGYTVYMTNGKISKDAMNTVEDIQRTIKGIQKVYQTQGIKSVTEQKETQIGPRPKDLKGTKKFIPMNQRIKSIMKTLDEGNIMEGAPVSLRTYKGKDAKKASEAKWQAAVAARLYKKDYVEIDPKTMEKKFGTGKWIKADKAKEKPKAPITPESVAKKLIKDENYEPTAEEEILLGEHDFADQTMKIVDAHNNANDIEKVFNIEEEDFNTLYSLEETLGKIKELDRSILELQIDLNEATDRTVKDILNKELKDAKDERKQLTKEKDNILDNNAIEAVLKTSNSKDRESIKGQPLDINHYVEVGKAKGLIGSLNIGAISEILGELTNDMLKSLKETIAPVVDDSIMQGETKRSQEDYLIKSSPARGLLYNKDGEVNKVVAAAMAVALNEYLAMGQGILGTKNREDIARMLGVTIGEVTEEQVRYLANKGVYTKNMANELGKAILKELNLKIDKEIPLELESKLLADLGQMAILQGIKRGDIEYTRDTKEADGKTTKLNGVDLDTHNRIVFGKNKAAAERALIESEGRSTSKLTVSMVRYTDQGKNSIRDFKDIHSEFQDTLHIEGNFTRGPKKTPVDKKDDYSIRNNEVTLQPEESKETLDKLREEEYVVIEDTKEWLLDANNREVILEHLGYTKEADLADLAFLTRESKEAKNEEITRSLENIQDMTMSNMYFDWFFSRNGRFMLDSNTINPQTDKLHRFMVVPKKHAVGIKITDEVLNSDGTVNDMGLFYIAVAQAFGMSTDKKSTDAALTFGKELAEKRDPDELLAALKDKKKREAYGVEVEHLSHYLQGVWALKALNKAKSGNKGTFITNLSMESDAVTSGFGLKLLQFPIVKAVGLTVQESVKNWLGKTGFFVGETVTSMNDEIASGRVVDSYKTLAAGVTPDYFKRANLLKHDKKLGEDIKKVDRLGILGDFVQILPKPEEDGTVSSALRNLFKYPFMIFNYSGGIPAIKQSIGQELADGIIDDIVAGKVTHDKLVKRLAGEFTQGNVKELITMLREEDPSRIRGTNKLKYTNIYDYLAKMGSETYGTLATNILSKEFGELVQANETINQSFDAMFQVYADEYKAKVAEYTQDGMEITSKVRLEIIHGLRDRFPLINAPFSTAKEYADAVAIISSKSTVPDYKHGSARTAIQEDKELFGTGKTKTVQSQLKEFEAAVNAGSVIPIHYIDASVMSRILGSQKGGIVGIHDAVIPPLTDTMEVIGGYNENLMDINKNYSVVKEIMDSTIRVLGHAKEGKKFEIGKGKKKEMVDASFFIDNIKALNETVQSNREDLFSNDIDVVHMSAVPGSKFSYKGTGTKTATSDTSRYTEAEMDIIKSLLFTKNGTMRTNIRNFANKYKINIEDC